MGATKWYGFFDFSVDWLYAKIPTAYYLQQNGQPEITGTEKLPYKNLQLKVGFTL
jgi:hypothetical protein